MSVLMFDCEMTWFSVLEQEKKKRLNMCRQDVIVQSILGSSSASWRLDTVSVNVGQATTS